MAVESPNLVPTFDGISWTQPKINWTETDKFNKEDYNRIKNNLAYLQCIKKSLDGSYEGYDLGEDITEYTAKFRVDPFNDFEDLVDDLNVYKYAIGNKKQFQANGKFIDYNELNRIESACLRLYEIMCNHYMGRHTLPAMLGLRQSDFFFNI